MFLKVYFIIYLCVYVCVRAHRNSRRMLDPLELESDTCKPLDTSAGIQTLVPWKGSPASAELSLLPQNTTLYQEVLPKSLPASQAFPWTSDEAYLISA